MGEVYRARDPRLGRDVAIKVIPETFATDASRLHRFEQEARAAGQLNHPNILAVYDVGIHDGAPYIVSELLEGESLRSRLQGGALPPRKAIDYARQIAEGLAAAHDKGIVHRDLKPDNLFVTSDGRIKILDFGIAKLTQPSDDDAPAHRLSHRDRGRARWWARRATCRRSRSAAKRWMPAPTSSASARSSTRCWPGVRAFTRETAAETMAAILKEDPPAAPVGRVAGARAHRRALSGEGARGAVSVGARSGVRPGSVVGDRRRRGAGTSAGRCFVRRASSCPAVGRGRRARYRACGRARVEPPTTRAAAARHSVCADAPGRSTAQRERRRTSLALSPDGTRLAYLATGFTSERCRRWT